MIGNRDGRRAVLVRNMNKVSVEEYARAVIECLHLHNNLTEGEIRRQCFGVRTMAQIFNSTLQE